jgi:uncharacterized heparinase superfamily protein
VPKDPIAGDKAAGEALMAGHSSSAGGRAGPVEGFRFDDPSFSPAFADYVHSFALAPRSRRATTRERGAALSERLVQAWLDCMANMSRSRVARDLWGRRILFWAAYAPYILSSKDIVYRSAVLNTLARGARHLEKSADRVPVGLPRISAWAGVIASALVIQGGPARLSKGKRAFPARSAPRFTTMAGWSAARRSNSSRWSS